MPPKGKKRALGSARSSASTSSSAPQLPTGTDNPVGPRSSQPQGTHLTSKPLPVRKEPLGSGRSQENTLSTTDSSPILTLVSSTTTSGSNDPSPPGPSSTLLSSRGEGSSGPEKGGHRPKRKLKPLRRKVSGGGASHAPRVGPMIKRTLPSSSGASSSASSASSSSSSSISSSSSALASASSNQGPNIRFSVYTRTTAPSRFPKALTCLTPPRTKGLASRFNMWDEAIPSPTHPPQPQTRIEPQTQPLLPPSLSLSPIQGTPMNSRITTIPSSSSSSPSSDTTNQPRTPIRTHSSSSQAYPPALHSTPVAGDVYGFAEAERRVQAMQDDTIPRRIFSNPISEESTKERDLDDLDQGSLSGLDTPLLDHAILFKEKGEKERGETENGMDGSVMEEDPSPSPSLLLAESPKSTAPPSQHVDQREDWARVTKDNRPSPPSSASGRERLPRRNPSRGAKSMISSYLPSQRTLRSRGKASLHDSSRHQPIYDPLTTQVSIEIPVDVELQERMIKQASHLSSTDGFS
ncbi:MAG: hypothetical protein DHS80DRAFT_24950 [Piptocephalis tieghemiana]|nr:MAG: hypothetical protein DHS80DRAFT_24950 [Piptocephalis tieghemiana]